MPLTARFYASLLGATLLSITGALHAGTIILNDGKTLQGIVSLVPGDANITLQSADKPAENYKFADVRTALFDGLSGAAPLKATGAETGAEIPWVRAEIGKPRRSASVEIGPDKITITDAVQPGKNPAIALAAGHAFNDNCCFVFQKLEWDGEILAHIAPGNAPGRSRAGLMICEGLDGQGPMALVARTSEPGNTAFVRRTMRGDEITTVGSSNATQPAWLKLTRSWDTLRALESIDGVAWTPIGECRVEMDDKNGVYIGVAARGNAAGGVVFDNIKLAGRRSPAVIPGQPDPRLRDAAVTLKDGTLIAGMLLALSEKGDAKIRITQRGPDSPPITIKPGLLARAQFAPMTPAQSETFATAGAGALTADGDFVEGDLRNVSAGALTVSSITFGLMTMEPGRALGAVFQPTAPLQEPLIEVRLQDGSLILAKKLTVDKQDLVIDEPLLGEFKAPLNEVISIDHRPAK